MSPCAINWRILACNLYLKAIDVMGSDQVNGFVWQQARKREMFVSVVFSTQDSVIETLEGAVRSRVGDAVVTDAGGERWPVPREHFKDAYESVWPVTMGQDGQYRSLPGKVEVARLPHPYRLELSGKRGTLCGKKGDWMVRKEDGSTGIVAGNIFSGIYDIIE